MRAENPVVANEAVWMAQPDVEAYSTAEGEVLAALPDASVLEARTPTVTATPTPAPSPIPSQTPTLVPSATPTPSPVPTQSRPSEPQRYRVESGDTVYRIAARFGVSADTILSANGLSNPNSIAVGQTILVLPVSGVAHQIKQGDSLSSIAALYGVAAQAIAEYNQIGPGDLLREGQTILVPGGKVPAPQPTATPTPRPTLAPTPTRVPPTPTPTPRPPTATPAPTSRPPAAPAPPAPSPVTPPKGSGQLAWPVAGVITQHFGTQGHEGLDIAAPSGTPVRAAADGRVVNLQQSQGGYGWYLVIDHGNGIKSLYSHLSGFNVKLGDTVKRGQQVGAVGSTGRATGPHLHFEVRVNDRLVNPMSYL